MVCPWIRTWGPTYLSAVLKKKTKKPRVMLVRKMMRMAIELAINSCMLYMENINDNKNKKIHADHNNYVT